MEPTLADRSADAFHLGTNRITHAGALRQSGHLDEAEAAFAKRKPG